MVIKNKELTLKEIRGKMLRKFKTPNEVIRPMNIDFILNDHGKVGTVLFSLNGSPPKGYAIYIPNNYYLYFYDIWGQRWKKLEEVSIPQIDSLIEKEKYKPAQYIFGGNAEKDPEWWGSLTLIS